MIDAPRASLQRSASYPGCMIAGRVALESMSAACGWVVRFFSRFDSWRCRPVAAPSSGQLRKTCSGPEVSGMGGSRRTLAFWISSGFCAATGVTASTTAQVPTHVRIVANVHDWDVLRDDLIPRYDTRLLILRGVPLHSSR